MKAAYAEDEWREQVSRLQEEAEEQRQGREEVTGALAEARVREEELQVILKAMLESEQEYASSGISCLGETGVGEPDCGC